MGLFTEQQCYLLSYRDKIAIDKIIVRFSLNSLASPNESCLQRCPALKGAAQPAVSSETPVEPSQISAVSLEAQWIHVKSFGAVWMSQGYCNPEGYYRSVGEVLRNE